ncbi:hypothetical protein ACFQ0B_21605 [Nonomuraea thailandensis]
MKAYLLDAAVARYVSDHTTAPDALLAALERRPPRSRARTRPCRSPSTRAGC